MSWADVLHTLVSELEKMTGHTRQDLHDAVDAAGQGPGPEAEPTPAPAADQPSDPDTPSPVFGSESAPEASDPHPESD